MTTTTRFLITLFFLGVSSVSAQITIGTATANPGDTNVCVPVEVTVGGVSHNATNVAFDFDGTSLTLPDVALGSQAPGPVYAGGTFQITSNLAQATGALTTADGEVFSACFDVAATASGVIPIDATAGPFTGVFPSLDSPAVTAGSIAIVPEPCSCGLLLIAAFGGLGFRRKLRK